MPTKLTESRTPLPLVRLWKNQIPECYDTLDDLRNYWLNSGEMSTHPACDIPISAAATWLATSRGRNQVEMAEQAAELTACYIWRKQKIIYSFDPDLAKELSEQAKDYTYEDDLPVDVLLHPPYPCVYIQCPGFFDRYIDGFFAWIEWDVKRSLLEFRVSFLASTMDRTVSLMLELPEPSLGACIASTLEESAKRIKIPQPLPNIGEINMLLTALNMYMYLCSDGADIQPNPSQAKITRRSPTVRDKFREVEAQDVGVRIGSVLRKSKAAQANPEPETRPHNGSHASKRPHTRRGHWHHYWTGPRDKPADRKLILKWTHPMLVAGSLNPDGGVITVFPVKNSKEDEGKYFTRF
jgi:hypothetical protein